MNTSDQQDRGPLTRKQLREIRLTGSTPVITPEEAAVAGEASPPAPPLPRAAELADVAPAPARNDLTNGRVAPLTRRQVREQERLRTGSVATSGADERSMNEVAESTPETQVEPPSVEIADAPSPIVSGVPDFSALAPLDTAGDDEGKSAPARDGDDVFAVVHDADDDDIVEAPRPTVNPAFGEGLLTDESDHRTPFRPSFDELLTVGDSTGSQHSAPNALIFMPPPGEGSLSGPVASTGEILVTGSYELPQGIGSQGHAHGTTDGKDIDAVLIDGELPPASSPTPIAASSAVSTIKPAGEVIRPPAPEKGNKLMLILAIVAGGLALALGAALIFAFTTNVF